MTETLSEPAQESLLASLPEDVLTVVLSKVPMEELLLLSTVSGRIARAAEQVFRQLCERRRWRPPRRPRGAAAQPHAFPWRALFRQHMCRACGAPGEFPVRQSGNHATATLEFLICKRCVRQQWVQARMVAGSLWVDLEGISGQKLLRKAPSKRKRS